MRTLMAAVLVAAAAVTACGDDRPPDPASVVVISGDSQTVSVGATLQNRIEVEVRDARGRPIPFTPVFWEIVRVLPGGGTVPEGMIVDAYSSTSNRGRADGLVRVGETPGEYRVAAIAAQWFDSANNVHYIQALATIIVTDD